MLKLYLRHRYFLKMGSVLSCFPNHMDPGVGLVRLIYVLRCVLRKVIVFMNYR